MNSMITIDEQLHIPAFLNSPDERKRPALIIIHEIWGLTDHMKDVSNRFAQQGYLVLTPDLFAGTALDNLVTQDIMEEIANPDTRDEAQKKMRAALTPLQSPEFGQNMMNKLKACFTYLKTHPQSTGSIGVVGFCFGGTYSYSLAVEQPDLKAAVPFYGHAPEPVDKVSQITCPILAFYGEKDTALIEALPALQDAMKKNRRLFEAIVYPDTGHAFFNDTNPMMYRDTAAKDAWNKTISFLDAHLS